MRSESADAVGTQRFGIRQGCAMFALTVGLIVVWIDQWTKYWVRDHFPVPGLTDVVIPGLFNLTYLRNTGAVWGLFQSQNEWLILFSFIVLLLLALGYRRLVELHPCQPWAVGFMLGGIVGNLIDRIKLGWVTDFLDFYVQSAHWHWPSFNVADAAICVGVGLYLVASLRHLPTCAAAVDAGADHG